MTAIEFAVRSDAVDDRAIDVGRDRPRELTGTGTGIVTGGGPES